MYARSKPLPPDVKRLCVLRFWRLGVTVPLTVAGIAIGAAGPPGRMATTIAIFLVVT